MYATNLHRVISFFLVLVFIAPGWIRVSGYDETAQGFQVTAVTWMAENPGITGCPAAVKFSGSITTNGAGTVKYIIIRSDGATTPVQTLVFNAAGTKEVRSDWQLFGDYKGWQKISILAPNKMESKNASFSLSCGIGGRKLPDDIIVIKPGGSPGSTSSVDGWNFESGNLQGWTATGDAFRNQPTLGDNVIADRVKTDMRLENGGIGGDYWKRIPHPIGHQGNYWLGTYENHPNNSVPLGTTSGDVPTGTLTSPEFKIERRYISFLIGGSNSVNTERVELQISASDFDRINEERRSGRRQADQLRDPLGNAPRTAPELRPIRRDGNWVVVLQETGNNSEKMRRQVWEVNPYLDAVARLRVVDESREAHINVDDIRMTSELPPDNSLPLWGIADTHAHPANYLGFGGNVIQGKLYSPGLTGEAAKRNALPPMFAGRPETQSLYSIMKAFGGDYSGAGGGYPTFESYPKFNNTIGQQMYQDWIKRAHSGGLRLMSTLAINNWLVSSHLIKIAALGTSAPIDDKESAKAQIEDIKRWASQNNDWVEIALSPADARRIISQNKLALVLGVELDLLGNFAPNRTWTAPEIRVLNPDPTAAEEAAVREKIAAELDELYGLGVRQITPFHYVSGVFGGTAIFNRMFNEVNRKFTGRNILVDPAGGEPYRIRYRINNDGWGYEAGILRTAATGEVVGNERNWENTPLGHANRMGLTRTGEILLEEAMRRGMLFDTDHASFKTTDSLLRIASANDYPLMSSHSDFLELGMTGSEEFTHNNLSDDHEANAARFGTTKLDNLRHEGMGTRAKFETIARLGGTTAPLLSTYRRTSPRGSTVGNDNEGSSKTWAQMYQYAVEVTGGRGVALSSDRGFINFIAPRFGPNSAYMLGSEEVDALKKTERGRQVEAQRDGVRYDTPIREWGFYRFSPPATLPHDAGKTSAYYYTGKAWEHEDVWRALAAFKAGVNPWAGRASEIPRSGAPGYSGRIENFARGFFASNEEQAGSGCGVGCTLAERYSAYYVKEGYTLDRVPARWRDDAGFREHFEWVSRVWTHWHRMEGNNEPLRRHIFGNRDFDINIDGAAHYGMLPDLLQDVKNVGLDSEKLSPLFRSAEDYVRMWEKCQRHSIERR